MRHRLSNLIVLLIAVLLGTTPSYATDEKPADGKPNRVERVAKKAAKGIEKAAKRTGDWAERTAKRTGKAVERAADKTDKWVKKQIE